jgi:hypothetical protein
VEALGRAFAITVVPAMLVVQGDLAATAHTIHTVFFGLDILMFAYPVLRSAITHLGVGIPLGFGVPQEPRIGDATVVEGGTEVDSLVSGSCTSATHLERTFNRLRFRGHVRHRPTRDGHVVTQLWLRVKGPARRQGPHWR